MPNVLDLVTARRWAVTSRLLLAGARERIDALNVFPVADGDTGTNMYLTVDGALEFLRAQHEAGNVAVSLEDGLALLARGMLLGARGNSGVILSQLARGLAGAVRGGPGETLGPAQLAAGFTAAAEAAWSALEAPVEGTILSVARAAAQGAREAVAGRPDGDVLTVASAAAAAARTALARTPEQLPALAAAGVVDAGGAGLLLVVEALEAVLEDRPKVAVPELPAWWSAPASTPLACAPGHGTGSAAGQRAAGAATEGQVPVEVMFLLTGSDPERASRLRTHLGTVGDSVVVAGGPTDWQVHVHLADPAAAVEAGSLAGEVSGVRLTSLADGSVLPRPEGPGDTGGAAAATPGGGGHDGTAGEDDEGASGVCVVACGLGHGVEQLFREAGAQTVASGPGHRASAGQLLAAARATRCRPVILLPNDGDTVMVARAAAQEARHEGLEIDVVPTRDVLAGLAAVSVVEPGSSLEDTADGMRRAVAGVRTGALTRADRGARTAAGPCRAGQWLGLVDHAVVAVDDDLRPVARTVLDRLWGPEAEVLTVLAGAGAEEDPDAEALEEVLVRHGEEHRDAEVVRLEGGQPTYPWLLGVE